MRTWKVLMTLDQAAPKLRHDDRDIDAETIYCAAPLHCTALELQQLVDRKKISRQLLIID